MWFPASFLRVFVSHSQEIRKGGRMEELKKCPFCGGEASLKVNHGFGEEVISAFVYCEECGVATRNCALEATARGMWNRRVEE